MLKKVVILSLFLIAIVTQAWATAPTVNSNKKITEEESLAYFAKHDITLDSCQLKLYESVYQWVGTRYKYSGKNGKGGLDCSGFAKLVYKETYNIILEGGSASIFPKLNSLNKEELEVGDLVFFQIKKGRISHVGIYLGNNKFAHSAVKGGVRIDDLDFPYYKRTFYKGGRL